MSIIIIWFLFIIGYITILFKFGPKTKMKLYNLQKEMEKNNYKK